ncbi:uncharacterized protein LOC126373285 [Pectinophora gossypiella]|nr:uncharacterized protein LOC126373285 [Pectinophora gossypiella]XP_049875327.1 uncharacterized protein LOC126373285 [Pectinophora gossypiella]
MARRKSVCAKWTLVVFVVIFCQFVHSRPQDSSVPVISSTTNSVQTDKATESSIRDPEPQKVEENKKPDLTTASPTTPNAPRNNKNKTPVLGESIKMVANQLLENPSNTTVETPVVIDTRIPPKLKNQIVHKHKIKTRNEDGEEPVDNSHPGEAVPVTMEELEQENKVSESSTSNEGISTWILLSNTASKDNVSSTEPTKTGETQKKQKPNTSKNKTKRPPNHKVSLGKRPIIGSTNKSDLVAGGSAINENVYNKIKDTVLSNVQKNKNQSQKTTTVSTSTIITTTASPTTEVLTTKKETVTKVSVVPVVKVTGKPTKKKNKNKHKTSTTLAPTISDSALLPMEPKEQEIELEISTPATTTKKPKRTSTRKKTKTKKRKTSKPKPEATTVSEVKTANKTKSTKTKKPSITSLTSPITSQIYNYLSREVMPSVGVGVLGLASLVGLAGYFLYPFSTPVRRTFEVDKKDDIYRHNAEEYASEGNGQAEEEMLGTVLAGMPAHSKHKLNPYAGQTAHINRYPVKKEQDIRYRHVAASAGYEPNYNVHYPQQKTGIAHGAVYAEPYNPHQYETRHVYTTEGKYVYDKGPNGYTPSVAVEPIYAAPQTGPQTGPSASAYGSDTSNSVVYGVKPSSDSDFKPVYPFEGQFYSQETTNSPMTYPPTSMYLGSNNDSEDQDEQKYDDDNLEQNGAVDNKFVVGNVPKELSDTATPAVVPEHGPRNLRRRRNLRRKRSIVNRIEEVLKAANDKKEDVFLSNEIDEALINPVKNLAAMDESPMKMEMTTIPEVKDVFTVYAVSSDPVIEQKITESPTTVKNTVVESVSTVPIDNSKQEKSTTETELINELETTTKPFRVYEVFSSNSPTDVTEQNSPLVNNENSKVETTTQYKNMNTETTTELKSETTSTMPPSPSPIPDFPTSQAPTTNNPEVLTYPPLNQDGGFFTFLKRLIEFKYRLGLSILQTTSENLNRYLRSMENKVQKVARASS